jgi:hypothetical protein
MSDSPPCQYGHTPDHIPTTHGEKGYCKVCLEYDYVAETVGVSLHSGVVVRPTRWTPSSALEIKARERRVGRLPPAPTPLPAPSAPPPEPQTEPELITLHSNQWQILTVLAANPKVALTQADIGERTDPQLSPQTVARWLKGTKRLKGLRDHGLTQPLDSGGECITEKGLILVRDR